MTGVRTSIKNIKNLPPAMSGIRTYDLKTGCQKSACMTTWPLRPCWGGWPKIRIVEVNLFIAHSPVSCASTRASWIPWRLSFCFFLFYDNETPNDAVTPQLQRWRHLLSSLVWIDHYNKCNGMTILMEFMGSFQCYVYQ